MLNLGHKFLGTGTSDSHDADDHPGAGRTFVYIGSDDPGRATSEAVVKGLKSGRAIMTTGPFVEATINDLPIGSTIERAGSEVTLKVKVQAASWVDVDQGIVWVNGHVRERFPIQLTEGRFRFVTNLTIERDSWVVIEVTGDSSMFPIYRPVDLPPVLIGDALASFADILGFGGDALGDLQPKLTGQHKPIALTNPIWIDVMAMRMVTVRSLKRRVICRVNAMDSKWSTTSRSALKTVKSPSLMQPKPKVTSSYGLPRFKETFLMFEPSSNSLAGTTTKASP